MSELTFEQYQDPEFFNPERWVDFTSKEMILLDPANGNPYKPGKPPEWIIGDERLAYGYNLHDQGGMKHELTILLGRHEYDSDLSPSVWKRKWYEKEADLHDAIGHEAAGRIGGIACMDTDSWFRRQHRAIEVGNKVEFGFDVENSARPLDQVLLDGLCDRADVRSLTASESAIIYHGVQFMRDRYFAYSYVGDLAQRIGLRGIDKPRALMAIGRAHEGIVPILNDVGVQPKAVFLCRNPNQTFADLSKHGVVEQSKGRRMLRSAARGIRNDRLSSRDGAR